MKRFLCVTVPHADDTMIDNVDKALRVWSYKRAYGRGIAPPNVIEYTFGPMSNESIEATKEMFRKLFVNIPPEYKNNCKFVVYDEE